MKSKFLLIVMMLLVILSFTVCKKNTTTTTTEVVLPDEADYKTFNGYLMDVTCGTKGIALDKVDIKTAPQDHTVSCLAACEASGYGLMLLNDMDGTFKFLPFDAKGNETAAAIVKASKKEKGIEIIVKCKKENDILMVVSLKEAE